MSAPPDDLPCAALVELITDILDGRLTPAEQARVDAHLETCPYCRDAIEQFRHTIAVSGRIDDADVLALDPDVLDVLVTALEEARTGFR